MNALEQCIAYRDAHPVYLDTCLLERFIAFVGGLRTHHPGHYTALTLVVCIAYLVVLIAVMRAVFNHTEESNHA